MIFYRQLNSNFHRPYEQGVDDFPLHGNLILSFLKLRFLCRLSGKSMFIQRKS